MGSVYRSKHELILFTERDTALQAKLDKLIRVSTAKNLFVGLEHLSPDEIEEIRRAVHGHP
jgi:low affinity Fe/Cu permease